MFIVSIWFLSLSLCVCAACDIPCEPRWKFLKIDDVKATFNQQCLPKLQHVQWESQSRGGNSLANLWESRGGRLGELVVWNTPQVLPSIIKSCSPFHVPL